jgi:hypothetical protein
MPRKRFPIEVGLGLFLAACASGGLSLTAPNPPPRDVPSPGGLSSELAGTRIPWWQREGQQEVGSFILVDGSDPISPPQGCGSMSPSGRFLACAPNVGTTGIEIVDLETGERRVLVRKDQDFPGAVGLGYPSFTPDEQSVIFDVGWPDHTDLATVDIDSGEIEYIDAPGIMNTEPQVSPDGQWILVACEGRQPGAGFVLCLIDTETGTREYLIDEALNLMPGSRFTADGQSVVYVAPVGGIDGEGQLYRIDIDDREKRLLVSGLHSADVVLAATAREVLFTCTFPDRPACSWVCVVGLDGADARRLTYLGEHCLDLENLPPGGP